MALAMSFTSCVRENLDQCPPLRINIEVKDKNYFNVDQTVPDENGMRISLLDHLFRLFPIV